MVGHNLAARSLRHLRFARRMMAGQPLLARVSNGHHASAYVSLDGYQLPVGRVLRRLPLRDSIVTESAAPGDSSIDDGWTPPVETVLRLLPRLPEYAAAAADTPADSATWQTPPAVSDERTRASGWHVDACLRRHLTDTQPPARAPMRPDGRRPHSRIVELPGVVSLPVAEEASEEDSPLVAQADAPPETDADSGADVATDAQSDDHEQPPQPLPALDEPPAVVSGEPASAPAVATAPCPCQRPAVVVASAPRPRRPRARQMRSSRRPMPTARHRPGWHDCARRRAHTAQPGEARR